MAKKNPKRRALVPYGTCSGCLAPTDKVLECQHGGRWFALYRCPVCQRETPFWEPSVAVQRGRYDVLSEGQVEQMRAQEQREHEDRAEKILETLHETIV